MHGDASQVEQVVLNLIMNAADAIGDAGGDIILRTGMTECTPEILAEYEGGEELTPGTYAYLEVADNGCGMSEETMRQVFEPFFTTKYSGHGLGMAAVIGIMRGHHGAIQVRSQLGVGTTFLAIFPAAKSTNEEPTPSDLAPLQHQSENWTGEGTVLFAEDMDNVQDVGRRILELLGFSVVCVHDGGEAIAVFAKSPDLFKRVILDLSMPVVDGIETWAEMRRIKPDVSVILCSGHGRREILQRVAPHRPAGIIEKPYEILAIQRCLRSLDEAEVEAGVVQEPVH